MPASSTAKSQAEAGLLNMESQFSQSQKSFTVQFIYHAPTSCSFIHNAVHFTPLPFNYQNALVQKTQPPTLLIKHMSGPKNSTSAPLSSMLSVTGIGNGTTWGATTTTSKPATASSVKGPEYVDPGAFSDNDFEEENHATKRAKKLSGHT